MDFLKIPMVSNQKISSLKYVTLYIVALKNLWLTQEGSEHKFPKKKKAV